MKTNPEYRQKGRRLGSAGGFFNQLMSNNQSVPVVGEGATELLYSDRHAYEVLEVNEKEKSCVIQRYNPKRTDSLGMSDAQSYEYKELTGTPFKLYWRRGAWRKKVESVTFTDEIMDEYGWNGTKMHEAYKAAGGTYNDSMYPNKIIEGMTKKKTSWPKMSIIFGVKKEYYDFSF